jgi:hypothetical protein
MLTNVRIEPKGECPPRMNKAWFELSSDITTFNLYEQGWTDIVAEGLSHLFENKNEFKERAKQWHETMEQRLTEADDQAVQN